MNHISIYRLVLWLLPLYPITFMYMIGSVPLGLIIYTPLLLVMLSKPKHLRHDKSYLALCIALIIDEVFQLILPYTSPVTIFHIIVPQIVYMLSLICVINYVTLEDLLKPYIVISLFYILGLFFQVYQLFVQHIPITGPILLFPNLISEKNVVNEEILRPMSFFQEPQAFATWMVVFLIIMLEKRKYWLAALATLSILLSTSTEGLVLCAVVWLLFIVFFKTNLFTKIIIIAGIVFLVEQYMTLELFSVGLTKLSETDYGENERIVQGFRMMKHLDLPGWLFGAGTTMNKYYLSYVGSSGITSDTVFMTSAAGTFVTNGIVVGVLYWLFLLKKITFQNRSLLAFSICLLIIPFAQSFFMGSGFVYVMALYYLLKQDVETNYENSTHRIRAGQPNA